MGRKDKKIGFLSARMAEAPPLSYNEEEV